MAYRYSTMKAGVYEYELSNAYAERVVLISDHGDFFFVMIRRQPRSTQSRSSASSDVYKRQQQKRDMHFQLE